MIDLHTFPHGGEVELIDHMGNDLSVVNAARVSFHKKKTVLDDKDRKLINYLAKHKHWTPFSHPQITVRVRAPISIRTQMFKHKVGFTENEVSRRYVSDKPQIFKPSKWMGKPKEKKQGAGEPLGIHGAIADDIYIEAVLMAESAYDKLIKLGVAPEQARFVLPQGTFTEWYWTGSLAAFARFYALRSSADAQAEVREYAEAIGSMIEPLYPISWSALISS